MSREADQSPLGGAGSVLLTIGVLALVTGSAVAIRGALALDGIDDQKPMLWVGIGTMGITFGVFALAICLSIYFGRRVWLRR